MIAADSFDFQNLIMMNQIPDEIILMIGAYLKYHKCLFRVVCKRFNKIFSNSFTLEHQYVWYMYLKKDVVKKIYGKDNTDLSKYNFKYELSTRQYYYKEIDGFGSPQPLLNEHVYLLFGRSFWFDLIQFNCEKFILNYVSFRPKFGSVYGKFTLFTICIGFEKFKLAKKIFHFIHFDPNGFDERYNYETNTFITKLIELYFPAIKWLNKILKGKLLQYKREFILKELMYLYEKSSSQNNKTEIINCIQNISWCLGNSFGRKSMAVIQKHMMKIQDNDRLYNEISKLALKQTNFYLNKC